MKSEIADLQSVLDELEASIRREIAPKQQPAQAWLPGFDPEEIDQVKKDIAALEIRLARIPNERAAEQASIEKHYANPVDRTFPVAVVFLLPANWSGKG